MVVIQKGICATYKSTCRLQDKACKNAEAVYNCYLGYLDREQGRQLFRRRRAHIT